ncbi:Intraflagellar transport protein 80 [Rhizophlyctis rosea]|uniref:Intraflagellar transport protein 80 n=1 Tax=Rhizophlyctis rosea TaxID=64517 RepID=A0AAD5X214_9FUNG|nr:Intraflagellar transport protein 80 [Rhizophlyctis rosea]
MKLKINQDDTHRHKDIVTCVAWIDNNELYSCGDDRQMLRWSGDGELLGPVATTLFNPPPVKSGTEPPPPVYVTEIHWFPAAPGKGQTGTDVYVVGGTDGRFYLCTKGGRLEKSVEAHKGALLSLRWNYEGSAIVTAGEDGQIKIWSRSGMLRSVLAQTGYPTYSVAWSPANDQVLFTNGRNLIIKYLQPSNKPNQWKAHDGVILKVDWNMVNNLILSGGEDRKYKVWDSYGRQLFSSSPGDHPITSIAWNPSGEMFAVASFNTLRVCDKLGWSYAMEKPNSGSIYNIAWTPDGTQMACAGGCGGVVFGHIINRRFEWKNYEVTVQDVHKIHVHDVVQGSTEHLEFRDRVVKASLGYGHLVVTTSSQCYVYSEKNWNTPAIVDLTNNGRVTCIQQSVDHFLLVDNLTGIQIYNYEARLVSSPKYAGLRADAITVQTIALSNDTLAVRDSADDKAIHIFDTTTGRPISTQPFKHTMEISELALSQSKSNVGRQLVVVDKNRDMYITPVGKANWKKLGTMVETFAWNSETDMLAAVMDYKFVMWYYPNVVFVDEDIAPLTRFEKDGSSFGKNAQITNFIGTQCTLRRADGANVTVSNITPLPAILQEHARKKQWEEAIRLCRYVKMPELWACLAAMAIFGNDLNTAEVAYAAIDEVQKVEYVCYIRDIPTPEGRAAELALLRHNSKEAETILLNANMYFRAIKMWIGLFNWDRALELAVKYKTHVDTVLYFREKYLRSLGSKETSKRFLQYAQGVTVDYEKIKAKLAMEEEAEKLGGKAKAYQ